MGSIAANIDRMARGARRESRMVLDDAERLLSLDEVAARLATSPTTVRQLIANGHIRTIRLDRRQYVRKSRLPEIIDRLEDVGLDELLSTKV